MNTSLLVPFLIAFFLVQFSYSEAVEGPPSYDDRSSPDGRGLPLSDVLPSSYCKDYEIRQLVSKGQHFKCFIEEEGVTGETKECTISGKCQTVSVRESTIEKNIDKWAILWGQAKEIIRTTRVVFEDAALTFMPKFIQERVIWSDAGNNLFGRSASAGRATTTQDARKRTAEAERSTYETYIADKRVIKKVCESAPALPGVFSLLVPLFPQSTACRPRGAVAAKNNTARNAGVPIWIMAEPGIVSLGERAVLSWGAGQNMLAHTCAVLGPGLKMQSAEGSASTVPITKTTTFTFTCVRLDGATTSVSTTIDLAF